MLSVLIIIFSILIDQITKYWAFEVLRPSGSISVIDHFLKWSYVENTGAGLSILEGHRLLLIVATTAICAVLIYLLCGKKVQHPVGRWSIILLIGGAIGNLIDRIFRGFVVDFIKISFFPFTFNVADIFVTVGAGLLILYLLFFYETPEEKNGK